MKARKTIVRTVATALGAGALVWLTLAGGTSGAAAPQDSSAMTVVAEEGPGYAIEDYAYPNADKILAERGITLKRGDGHITLADCGSGSDLLEVRSRLHKNIICFKVTGTTGYLALELPKVYLIKGNSYATEVDLTVGTEETTVTVEKNTFTPVGETTDPEGRDFTLMEIRTSR
ncbi:hypothetical protein [Streptomyces sp. NPDC058955]|uniref:hypothetical protein n=1 Tax=unclassified Streptomyces TaxID=2593676 RepID=UPI00365D6FB4